MRRFWGSREPEAGRADAAEPSESPSRALSRRSLFTLGAARVAPSDENLAALGATWRSYAAAEAGTEESAGATARVETTDYAALKDEARAAWETASDDPIGRRLAPVADALIDAAGVTPGQGLLDIAAGDGNLALAAVGAGARVTALDLSPRLVERGRERTERAGVKVEWVVGDAEALPFANDSFDCVASSFGAMYALRPQRAGAELVRVARPGAVVAMANWASSGFMSRVLGIAETLHPRPKGVPRPARWGRFESLYLYLAGLSEGFEMTPGSIALEFESADSAWSAFSTPPGPLAVGVTRAEAAARERAKEDFLAVVEAHASRSSSAPVAIAAEYVLVVGRKPAPAAVRDTGEH